MKYWNNSLLALLVSLLPTVNLLNISSVLADPYNNGSGGYYHNGSGGYYHNGSGGYYHNGSGGYYHNGSGSYYHNGSGSYYHNGSGSYYHNNYKNRYNGYSYNHPYRYNGYSYNHLYRPGEIRTINTNRIYVTNNHINFVHRVRWYGGGWYGWGYYTPPAWGLIGFAAGLTIGAILSAPPPYYSPVYVYNSPTYTVSPTPFNYIYSEGVFLQRNGDSYVVIQPPLGAVVTYLPQGCTIDNVNSGDIQYNCSGVFYKPFYRGHDILYRVIGY